MYPKGGGAEVICSGKTFLVGLSPTCWVTGKEFASSVVDQKEQQRPHYKVYILTCSLSCYLSVQFSLEGGIKITSLKVIRIHCKIEYIPTDQEDI